MTCNLCADWVSILLAYLESVDALLHDLVYGVVLKQSSRITITNSNNEYWPIQLVNMVIPVLIVLHHPHYIFLWKRVYDGLYLVLSPVGDISLKHFFHIVNDEVSRPAKAQIVMIIKV